MIQRKQSLFLLLALILDVICLCMPVGAFVPEGMGVRSEMYNLWIMGGEGAADLSVWWQFAILLLACPLLIVALLAYKKRMAQSRYCIIAMLMHLLWCVAVVVNGYVLNADAYGSFAFQWAALLPVVSLVFTFMARKAVLADEALVRAADRIR